MLMAFAAHAQQVTVTGRVLDASLSNEPLIGATVAAITKDGKQVAGAVTDYDGRFSLSLPDNTTALAVSYLGYNKKNIELKPGKTDYTVRLSPAAHTVAEVVVTGYQKIDRRKLTASVSTVKISDETVGAVKNIDQALAGQVAGLAAVSSSGAPGAPVKIRIRGTASLNGTQEPLWVLDGIPLEGTDIPKIDELNNIDDVYQTSIAGINPADIDNITVLKDAAATAIYGARAANGVIVITTKHGHEGKPVINFSTKLTYSPRTDISRLNLLNAQQKVDLELGLLSAGYAYRPHKGCVANILDNLGEYNTFISGGWNALSEEAQKQINSLKTINNDWNDILFRNVLNKEYNASVSGGSDRSHYYASLGYYDEQGVTKGVDNNRYNLTMKTDFRVNSHLKLGLSVFANQRKQNSFLTDTGGFTNPVYYSRRVNPYYQPFDSEGNYIYDTNVQGRESEVPDFNIYEERDNTYNRRRDNSFMGILDAELKIMTGLTLTSQFGIQLDNYRLKRYAGQDSYAMRKEKEYATYVQADGSSKSIFPDGGYSKVTESHSRQWTWKAMLEWNRVFSRIHDVELMAGTEVRRTKQETLWSAAYGYDARTMTTQPVIFPSQDVAEQYPLHKETFTDNAYVSWFTTGSYTLLHRYTLGGSVRWDGSDVFGVAKKYRYLPLYSASALWRVGQENWMKDVGWISNLDLRLSYGLQGNIDKNTSPYLIGTYDRVTILPNNTERVISTETAPNPNLKWEKTSNVNIGIDLGLFDNRIRLTIDHYYRKSTDLIGQRMLPLETGFSSTTINWASMENRGWEIALNAMPVRTKDWKWTATVNLGFNTNKVLHESVAENETYPSREGHPVGALFAYKTAGLDSDGYPLLVNADGSTSTLKDFLKLNNAGGSTLSAAEQRAQYTYMGTTDPKCSGGFINELTYKSWLLSVNIMFNLGMKVRVQPDYSPTNYDRGLNTNTEILRRWTDASQTGLSAAYSKLMTSSERPAEFIRYSEYDTYSMLDVWVRSQSYARLQSVRLGYKLPKTWLKPLGIESASLSLEGRNLFVVASDYTNYLDPETMGNPYAQPVAKSLIFGLSVNF